MTSLVDVGRQGDRIARQVMSNDEAREVAQTYEGMIAALDSLEIILFGDNFRRSRDELEARAAEAVCALNATRVSE